MIFQQHFYEEFSSEIFFLLEHTLTILNIIQIALRLSFNRKSCEPSKIFTIWKPSLHSLHWKFLDQPFFCLNNLQNWVN